MKKLLIITMVVLALVLTSCSSTHRSHTPPVASELPSGFEYVRDAGNGYYLYSSPVGYFLVSIQIQGKIEVGFSNRFIDMVYIGRELAK